MSKKFNPKDSKFKDGGKVKVELYPICAECGEKISKQEDSQNEGLCNGCFDNILKGNANE